MPHEILASLRIPLPDKPADMIEKLGVIASAWAKMLASVEGIMEAQQTFTVNETRTKAPRSAIVTARAPRRRTTTEARTRDDATQAVHDAAEELL
jgi:hypothetical protein